MPLLLLLASAAPATSPTTSAPPAALGLDPFYGRYVDAGGIPIVSSLRVSPEALFVARDIIDGLLARRPDLRRELVRQGVRVGIMAEEESTTDLPEQRHWKKPSRDDPRLTQCELKRFDEIERMSDRDYWDRRARGTGGTYTTVGVENLLGRSGTRYFGESILVHEFSHRILAAVEVADRPLFAAIERAYADAIRAGRWRGDYAGVTLQEYWAEGTQFWFDTNMLARLDDAAIVSHDDLRRYDPALFAVLARVYGRRHVLAADVFNRHPARLNVPEGYRSADC
ncbi:glycoside hydrolase [Sphingomonas parva]|uniref:Glycoside hydrolase n=1 Tax=Sphingomonas parva TaxID=2555898 RepID=A0A4Y8ZK94_9SPHN|nr:glycoside hydrolase [Sphingomonas parva]TFI56421.1 glycoside hydrolase [Sphingomonas parva]